MIQIPKSSASKIHKISQSVLKEVITNLHLPPGWILQFVDTEHLYEEYGVTYKIDVYARWRYKSEKYELFVEVQKNESEKEFLEKMHYFINLNKCDSKKIFNIVWEKDIPENSLEMWDWLKGHIQVPW